MTDLRQRLLEAAEGSEPPLRTDLSGLLGRARAERRRRRALPALALVACIAVGVPLATARLGPDAGAGPRPAAPAAPSPRATTTAQGTTSTAQIVNAPLANAEVVRRCAPQMAKYDAFPRWRQTSGPTSGWSVVNADRTQYRTGDVVAIQERDGGPGRLCLIPQRGRESDDVPLTYFLPAVSQGSLIAQICSEAESTGRPVPDLRRATVITAQRTDTVLSAVLRDKGQRFGCTIPATAMSGNVYFETRGPLPASPSLEAGFFSSASLSTKTKPAAGVVFWGNGVLPTNVSTLELRIPGQSPVTFPVRDGAFGFAYEAPRTQEANVDVVLLDRNGKVLYTRPRGQQP